MYQGIEADLQQAATEAFDSGLYVSTIQFKQPDGNFGPSGAPSGDYVNVPGLVDLITGVSAIGCMDSPLSPGTISALEAKSLTDIESEGIRHVSLNGYYPQVVSNWQGENENMNWRAVIDSVNYEVFGVERDSQKTQTRVKLRIVLV